MKVLIIEDDIEFANNLMLGLNDCGIETEHKVDGLMGLEAALSKNFDVIILDRMLPDLDGLSLLKRMRKTGSTIPVLLLSALGEINDKVTGLKAGGDDYLVKPYSFTELLARLEALVRRANINEDKDFLTLLDLKFDVTTHKVTRGRDVIRLQPRELHLLEFFLRRIGQVITRKMLLEQVWGLYFDPQTNVIDTQISRLRAKIDKGYPSPLLHTIRGKGYQFDVQENIEK